MLFLRFLSLWTGKEISFQSSDPDCPALVSRTGTNKMGGLMRSKKAIIIIQEGAHFYVSHNGLLFNNIIYFHFKQPFQFLSSIHDNFNFEQPYFCSFFLNKISIFFYKFRRKKIVQLFLFFFFRLRISASTPCGVIVFL